MTTRIRRSASGGAAAAFAVLLLTATPAAARPFELSLTTGADLSEGDYGGFEDTSILVVPFSLRAKSGGLRVSATLPYLRIEGPAGIVAGAGGEPSPIILNPFLPGPREVRKGLGDLSLGATWSLPYRLPGRLEVDLTARVKLPTSSRRRALGTGKADVTLAAEASRTIGLVTPFVALGYRVAGDPAGFDLRDTVTGSAGLSVPLGRLVAVVSYDFGTATSRFSRSSHSFFAALSGPVGKHVTLTTYGAFGITDGAPDIGLGVLASLRIF